MIKEKRGKRYNYTLHDRNPTHIPPPNHTQAIISSDLPFRKLTSSRERPMNQRVPRALGLQSLQKPRARRARSRCMSVGGLLRTFIPHPTTVVLLPRRWTASRFTFVVAAMQGNPDVWIRVSRCRLRCLHGQLRCTGCCWRQRLDVSWDGQCTWPNPRIRMGGWVCGARCGIVGALCGRVGRRGSSPQPRRR